MKVFLMYRDRDFDPQQALPPNEAALTQDLELTTLFNAMALGDKFLFNIARQAVLSSLSDPDTILYRQAILRDCLRNPAVVREIYQIPIEADETKRKYWLGVFSKYSGRILHSAIQMMQLFVELLRKLKRIADQHAGEFESEGFTRFFDMIHYELDDEYFASVEEHLRELEFRNGVLISAELGKGNEGANYVLRKPNERDRSWVRRALTRGSPVYTFSIHPRDEHGARALSDLRERGIDLVANALAESANHIDDFLKVLQTELAFYVGCINLYERLTRLGEPVAFPVPAPVGERRHSAAELYDVCLALTMQSKVVGNDIHADQKDLVIITGANQGGKSTFLRSVGLAQMMMQCGMFAPAESFCANVCARIFTHYKREEDVTMTSGKFDEELGRMSEIVDWITPDSMVLFNESFAATNEREGSEIARQIVMALLEARTKVFFVTHLGEFARGFYDRRTENALFLRAERQEGGVRTFKLIVGEPLQTSYGHDLYQKVFGEEGGADGEKAQVDSPSS